MNYARINGSITNDMYCSKVNVPKKNGAKMNGGN